MDGIKRLDTMVEGQKDSALINVVEFLKTKKNLATKFLNEEKTLAQMCCIKIIQKCYYYLKYSSYASDRKLI